jgi:FtsH-binding integral membrane protein
VKTFTKIFFALAAFAPAKIFACATCYGANVDTNMTQGMNFGIATLLGVVVTVLATFGAFLVFIFRRSAALAAAAEKSKAQVSKL